MWNFLLISILPALLPTASRLRRGVTGGAGTPPVRLCRQGQGIAALSWQYRRPHQKFVHRARALTSFADRPDDKRLATTHIAGCEYLCRRGRITTLPIS